MTTINKKEKKKAQGVPGITTRATKQQGVLDLYSLLVDTTTLFRIASINYLGCYYFDNVSFKPYLFAIHVLTPIVPPITQHDSTFRLVIYTLAFFLFTSIKK